MNLRPFRFWRVALGLLAVLLTRPGHAAFVYETATELTSTGDFDGNGQLDVVVVDRATGLYRLGYRQASGPYTWAAARPSGIEDVSSIALGRLLSDSLDALAFASPNANRINVLSAPNSDTAAQPISWFSPGIGPAQIAALDIGGPGNTARDDLFISTTLNGLTPDFYALARNAAGGSLTPLATGAVPNAFRRTNPVRLQTGLPLHLGALLRTQTGDLFKVFDLTSGSLAEIAAIAGGLPPRSDYVFGNFDSGNTLAQFLFYSPPSSLLYLRPVQELSRGSFSFGVGGTFDLGLSLFRVLALPQGGTTRLLVLFGQGESARLYDFDGLNPPVPGQAFSPPTRETFTTAVVQSDGSFLLLSGAAGSGRSTRFQPFTWTGSTYAGGRGGTLPPLSPLSHTANVLHFNSDPFSAANARMLGQVNAGDWSSQYTLAGGNVTAVAETFGGSAAGLQNPTPLALGPPPAGTAFGLINQYRSEISLFTLSAPAGDAIADVSITPAPGEYRTSVSLALSSRTANVTLFYRVNNLGNWRSYAGPFWLFQDSTVTFYAQPNAGPPSAKSAIHQARYTFSAPPSTGSGQAPGSLDSDGDGVPDYVEIAKGLDPVASGNDADHDGFFDLDELVHGHDPNNPNNHPPTGHARLELNAAIDLIAAPRPWDGVLQAPSVAANGTALQAFDLNGALLAANAVISDPSQTGGATPAAVLSNIVVDTTLRLCLVGTPPHYDIVTSSPDQRIGRELLRLVDSTRFSQPIQFPDTWGNGPLNAEADNWIAAVSNQLRTVHRLKVPVDLTVDDTLSALLVERKLQELLLSRGLTYDSNVTLFPFRPADIQRSNPPAADLVALEAKLDPQHPAYSLRSLLHTIEDQVALPAVQGPAHLKELTRDIYRLSSASNNVPANATNGWPFFPSPVNVLRDFIAAGALPSNYLARTAVSAANRTRAYLEARAILDQIAPRPVTNVTLVVRADTFAGPCTLLDSLDHTKIWDLLQPDASPYPILAAFQLLPGSRVFVTGYTDVTNGLCAASGLEALTISLEFIPAVTPEDTDGDLLLDALELALFGDLSQGSFGDADADGYSNLEEQLAGTDPKNGSNFPGAPKVITGPPRISLQSEPGGSGLVMSWSFPPAYAGKVLFQVLTTPALGTPFDASTLTPVEVNPGQYRLSIPIGVTTAEVHEFFQLQMKLK